MQVTLTFCLGCLRFHGIFFVATYIQKKNWHYVACNSKIDFLRQKCDFLRLNYLINHFELIKTMVYSLRNFTNFQSQIWIHICKRIHIIEFLDFRNFWFNTVYNSILFSFPLLLLLSKYPRFMLFSLFAVIYVSPH